ncbi:MAG: histidine phosphatase family protein [Clostridia bacterium]|nr:histidine phosphatase family protein [Clostridia bacterium]
MRILIIRHGEPDYAKDSLTPKGWREADLLANRLAQLNISDYYLSPLGRAQDTARATLLRVGKTGETLPWLHEFRGTLLDPDTGERRIAWDLLPQFWTKCPELYDPNRWTENAVYKTGNSAEIYRETQEGLDALLARYGYRREGVLYHTEQSSDATIALFCHFGIAMNILSCLTGISLVPMMHAFIMAPSSVTTVISEERRKGEVFFRCAGLGDVSHLYAAGEPESPMGRYEEVQR